MKTFFFLYPIRYGLKCNCFLKTLCIGNSLICFLFLPSLKVLHSVSIYYVFYLPSAPPLWEILMLLSVLKNGTLKVWEGRNPTLQPAVLSRLPLETSIGAEVCEKMLYCTAILLSCFT